MHQDFHRIKMSSKDHFHVGHRGSGMTYNQCKLAWELANDSSQDSIIFTNQVTVKNTTQILRDQISRYLPGRMLAKDWISTLLYDERRNHIATIRVCSYEDVFNLYVAQGRQFCFMGFDDYTDMNRELVQRASCNIITPDPEFPDLTGGRRLITSNKFSLVDPKQTVSFQSADLI